MPENPRDWAESAISQLEAVIVYGYCENCLIKTQWTSQKATVFLQNLKVLYSFYLCNED